MSDAETAETIIVGAEIGAGHDGAAEMIVSLRYGNGVVGQVALDADVGFTLMQNCGVASINELKGHSWRRILEEL